MLKQAPQAINTRIKRLVQEFNKKYFAGNALNIQKKAMHDDELWYDGHHHCQVIKRLFVINKCLYFVSTNHWFLDLADSKRTYIQHMQAISSSEFHLMRWRQAHEKERHCQNGHGGQCLPQFKTQCQKSIEIVFKIWWQQLTWQEQQKQQWQWRSAMPWYDGAHKSKDRPQNKHNNNDKLSGEVNSTEVQPWVQLQEFNSFEHFPAASLDNKMCSGSEYISDLWHQQNSHDQSKF